MENFYFCKSCFYVISTLTLIDCIVEQCHKVIMIWTENHFPHPYRTPLILCTQSCIFLDCLSSFLNIYYFFSVLWGDCLADSEIGLSLNTNFPLGSRIEVLNPGSWLSCFRHHSLYGHNRWRRPMPPTCG